MTRTTARLAILIALWVPALGHAQELLTNGNLNALQATDWIDIPASWTVSTDPQSINTPASPIRFPAFPSDYSEHTNPGGAGVHGFVFNSTEGDFPGFPDVILVDGDLSQTVSATPGKTYKMTGWAYFE